MQFVIWGNGHLGKIAFEVLGKKRVKAIIDSNKKLQGTTYQGIEIISVEEYEKKFLKYPIIITPEVFEKEISELLESRGIFHYFFYSSDMSMLVELLMQINLDVYMKNFGCRERIVIYGYSLTAMFLYEILSNKGFSCVLLLEEQKVGLKKYLEEKWNISCVSSVPIGIYDRVILTHAADFSEEIINTCIVDNFLEIEKREEVYKKEQLYKFKNIHKGQRCFIVGTGPSLKMEDLDCLYEQKEICFSVNGIFKAFERTKWRPDYYVLSDPIGMIQWKEQILQMDVKEKFISDIAFFGEDIPQNIYKWHLNNEWKGIGLPPFSNDFSTVSYSGSTVTYDGALQLAVYMGFRDIYLLGVDCTQNNQGSNHFVDEYQEETLKNLKLSVDRNVLAYQAAKQYAQKHGINIYNATRGGALEVFERVNFSTIFD